MKAWQRLGKCSINLRLELCGLLQKALLHLLHLLRMHLLRVHLMIIIVHCWEERHS